MSGADRGFATPSFGAVLRRQVGLLFPGPFLMLFAMVVPMLIPLQVWRIREEATGSLLYDAPPAFAQLIEIVWFVGLVWALLVWREEGGDRRSFHRAFPVDATLHDLARVGAGALCLILCLAIATGVGLVVSAVEGSWYLTAQITPLWWLNALTAPLIAYLLGSLFAMGSSRPIERLALAAGVVLGASFFLLLLVAPNAWLRAENMMLTEFVTEEWLGIRWMAQGGFTDVHSVEDLRYAGFSHWALYHPITRAQFGVATLLGFALTIGGLLRIARRRA